MDIPGLIQHYGYLAVAVGAFLEGEAILLAAGAAAYRGYLLLSTVVLIGAVASFLGNQLYFAMGRRYGLALLEKFPKLQSRTRRVNMLLNRYHFPLMLALQFLYGLRVAGALAVGMSDVPWFRFLIVNFIGAFGWALIVTGGGYGFGQALAWLKAEFNADVAWIIVPVLLTAMLAWMSLRRRASRVSGK